MRAGRHLGVIANLQVVDDVPAAFAAIVVDELSRSSSATFRLGCSGGNSGRRCFTELAGHDTLPWQRIGCYFADERCVDPTNENANVAMMRSVLAPHLDKLAGFYPMSCDDGAEVYERALREAGHLDLLQLGFGPDGHTASLFPSSRALSIQDRLVATNVDPSGNNPFDRMTLTFAGIALADLVVFTVVGADKAVALQRVDQGEDLPASRVRAARVLWVCDPQAASLVSPRE